MSRSAPTNNNPNPSSRWFKWQGTPGVLSWYNKDEPNVNKRDVIVPFPFKFLVLDALSTVSGYSEDAESGIYSNEVRDVRSDVLLVKMFKGGQLANGLWENIKDKVKANGGKFASSVYIAYRENKDSALQIGNIKMAGCALGPWFDFKKQIGKGIDEKAVVINVGEQAKKGATKFYPPTFSVSQVSAETNDEAIALDKQLQDFLRGYLKQPIADKLDQRTGYAEEEADQRTHDEPEEHCERVARTAPAPPPAGRRHRVDPDLDAPEEDDIPF